MPKATEGDFSVLHGLVTAELTNRIRKGEDCATADLKAAIDWLTKNNVTGVATDGTPLKALLDGLTDGDKDFVEKLTT
jgi:hypothetical protein